MGKRHISHYLVYSNSAIASAAGSLDLCIVP
jgi:hypothetical protein